MAEFSAMEPTLNKDLPDLVRAAKKTGYEVIHVISNGVRLQDPAYAELLVKAGVNKVTISLHSADARTEAYLSGNPLAFEQKLRALANLVRLRKTRPLFLSINTVLTARARMQAVPVIELAGTLGVKQVNMYAPKICGNAKKNLAKIVPRFRALRPELRKACDAAEKHDIVLTFIDIPPCIYHRSPAQYGRRLQKEVVGLKKDSARLNRKESDFMKQRSFGTKCSSCAFFGECDGVEKAYTRRYGWNEFKPVI